MATTQSGAESGAKTKETKKAEAVPVKQNGDAPLASWQTDMERLMEDVVKSWSDLPAFKPFAGFLAPMGAEAPGLQAWRDQADRYFADFNRRWGEMARGGMLETFALPGMALKPEVDISEADGEFVLKADLPGLDKDDLDVEVGDGVLTISGKKEESSEEKRKDFHRRERRFGSFRRSFALPEGVSADKAEASFDKGVLTVTVPKHAESAAKGRKVAIKG